MSDIERLWRHDDEARFAATAHYDQRAEDLAAVGSRHAATIVRRARLAEIEDPEPPRSARGWYER